VWPAIKSLEGTSRKVLRYGRGLCPQWSGIWLPGECGWEMAVNYLPIISLGILVLVLVYIYSLALLQFPSQRDSKYTNPKGRPFAGHWHS